ncbi:MAG: hypothetical protein C0601_02075 [Candidatus Muiribacterium halophilum]|uniref:Uncharacterized protein n=1 Tax=Muiribacterium halophilum TaxID=2053465 RepID=A0A2N5ZL02_MUIH1|nr:MAG: hypothetical protein C0601_02075 [Candidatus Muirbacterium halophilum]
MKKEYPDVLNKKGVLLFKKKKYSDAIKLFKKAIEMNGKYVEAYVNLGITYSDAGLREDAVKAFTKASILDPLYMDKFGLDLSKRKRDDSEMFIKEARLAFSRCEYQRAMEYVEAAVSLKPEYPDYRNFQGEVYLRLNRLHKARLCFEKALDINPSYWRAKRNLSYILYLKGLEFFADGMKNEMLKLWRKAISIYPKTDLLKLAVNLEFTNATMKCKCTNCENFIENDFKYCPHCGLKR